VVKIPLLLILILIGGGIPAEATGTTFVVNTTADTPGPCLATPGGCSLRGAIESANLTSGATIKFALPGCNANQSAACTIMLTADLDPLMSNITVDGFSQPGSNSKSAGSKVKPGVWDHYNPCHSLHFQGPEVAIDASGAAIALAAMSIGPASSNVTIKGLAIYGVKGPGVDPNFGVHAIVGLAGTGTGRIVEKNFIGVLQNGTDPGVKRNQGFGVRQLSPGNMTASWNYIGYNGQGGFDGEQPDTVVIVTQNEAFKNGWNSGSHDGIDINGHDGLAQCNLSRDNTNNTGVAKGDAGNGIEIGSKSPLDTDGELLDTNRVDYNTLYRNGSAGLSIRAGVRGDFYRKNLIWDNWVGISVNTEGRIIPATNRHLFSMNSIFKNQGIGIDLQQFVTMGATWLGNPDGPAPNDACDVDGGLGGDGSPLNTASNDLQNYPVLTLAKRHKKNTIVEGYLNSTPNTTFDIEFYATPATDMGSSQDREGKFYLGHAYVTTNGAPTCKATFNVTIPNGVSDSYRITAIARIYEDDPLVPGTAAQEPWSTSEFSAAIKPPQQDSDDYDSDGKRDDHDSDCDNDGRHNDEDSDDDNDGKHDDEDSDDDSDGVKDHWDHKGRKETQDSHSDRIEPGQQRSYQMSVGAGTLAVIAGARKPLEDLAIPDPDDLLEEILELVEQPLQVQIYNPLGMLVATSLPLPGMALATTVPVLPGVYTVKVRNVGTIAHNYDGFLVTRAAWLP